MNKIPSAVSQAAKLMKEHPESFKDCSLTQILIAQAMEQYRQDCNEYIVSKQNINVFDNPEQIGLSKMNEELNPRFWGADNKVLNAK